MTELLTFRTSLVYVESVIDVLTGGLKAPAYAFLANRFAYVSMFDESNSVRGGVVEPPWPDASGRSFWRYYFEEQKPLDAIKGEQAWRGVTPFRHRFPLQIGVAVADVRVAPEAFLYPHGIAVVFNLTMHGAFSPEAAAAFAVDLRRAQYFTIDGDPKQFGLDAVADRALTALRGAAFGDSVAVGRTPQRPFTVTSVIQGSGVDKTKLPTQDGPEHRFLDAVTTWSATWDSAALPSLVDAALDAKKEGVPLGHVLYKQNRGRAVWFPGFFTMPTGRVRTLGCYHRNLVLASMQVESLATFAAATVEYVAQDEQLLDAHYDAARRAGDVLGRFYGGAQSIYRTQSVRAQMDDGKFVDAINAMRGSVDRPPLHA